jgi:hypothetical protein
MDSDTADLHAFRRAVQDARADPAQWYRSRALVAESAWRDTVTRLIDRTRVGRLEPQIAAMLRDALLECADRDNGAEQLKRLTGLPSSKAVRALAVLFGLAGAHVSEEVSGWDQGRLEAWLRTATNPFDVLLDADVASVLDLGAGDLTFAAALADQYVPPLAARSTVLTLHCVDRAASGSRAAAAYQADPPRLRRLKAMSGLQFGYWDNQDMFALASHVPLWSRYTVATCQAPATPTFAYEPTRFNPDTIAAELRRTKGSYRHVRVGGETMLEVDHAGKHLLFPPWKFEIRGPLALLDLLARRGKVCVIGAIDGQVFWELLGQLIDDPALRPHDVVLTSQARADRGGRLVEMLNDLPIGSSLVLDAVTALRRAVPRALPGDPHEMYRFRYVEVRRGATFPGIPAGRTALTFAQMKEEAVPWFVTLVPEH